MTQTKIKQELILLCDECNQQVYKCKYCGNYFYNTETILCICDDDLLEDHFHTFCHKEYLKK